MWLLMPSGPSFRRLILMSHIVLGTFVSVGGVCEVRLCVVLNVKAMAFLLHDSNERCLLSEE